MSTNRIVKDFKDWNLITEGNDIVGSVNPLIAGGATHGAGDSTVPGGPPVDAKVDAAAAAAAAKKKGGGGGGAALPTTTTTTLAPIVPKTPAELDILVKEIANMIVALFVDDNPIWTTNDLNINARRRYFDDTEEDGVKIFEDYWTKKILPKINMLPAENTNKASLTALKTKISAAIMARTEDVPFKITVSTSPYTISYTINADF
jgi:hypothetical protein